jgi:fatty acid desaturase
VKPNEKANLREAFDVVKDLMRPKPWVYWADLFLSAGIGWGCLYQASSMRSPLMLLPFSVACVLLYRGVIFIHELTHLNAKAVPGFERVWNLLIGIPLLVPSFMYQGVHQDHHTTELYGTANDPEYYPLAQSHRLRVIGFLLVSFFVPVLLTVRFLLLTPLSRMIKPLRKLVVQGASSMVINPDYKRAYPLPAKQAARFQAQETAASVFITLVVLATATGLLSRERFLVWLAAGSVIAFVNQVRTLLAHHFDNHGESMSHEEQLLDSLNYPEPWWVEFWAPVGLRYHALHHYMPGLPYHSLGTAHRRLVSRLKMDNSYHQAHSTYPGVALKRWLTGTGGARDKGVQL